MRRMNYFLIGLVVGAMITSFFFFVLLKFGN